jgi:hypothetical protein
MEANKEPKKKPLVIPPPDPKLVHTTSSAKKDIERFQSDASKKSEKQIVIIPIDGPREEKED